MAHNEAQKLQQDLGAGKLIELFCPVVLADGSRLERLTLRRAKVGDLRAVAHIEGEIAQELALLARLCGLVPEDLEALDFCDYKQLQDFFRTCTQAPVAAGQ